MAREDYKNSEAYQKKMQRILNQKFEELKEWIELNKKLPKSSSSDKKERQMARSLTSLLPQMQEQSDFFSHQIKEYQQLISEYAIKRVTNEKNEKKHDEYKNKIEQRSIPEDFIVLKRWIEEHGRFPRYVDEEIQISNRLYSIIKEIEHYPEEYAMELEQYKQLRNRYTIRGSSVEQHFAAWKEWTLEHKIAPSERSQDNEEKKVAYNMQKALISMRTQLDKYGDILKEYEQLYEQYGRQIMRVSKTIEEHFAAWKKWTLEHKITPSRYSQDNEEKKVAQNMSYALISMRKQPDKYEVKLKEYEQLYEQYINQQTNRNKTVEQHSKVILMKHFAAWKKWTLEHKITPSERSQDDEEKRVTQNMYNALRRIKNKTDEEVLGILQEYQKLTAQYGRKKLKKLKAEKDGVLSEVQGLKTQAVAAQEENDRVSNMTQESSSPHLPGEYD